MFCNLHCISAFEQGLLEPKCIYYYFYYYYYRSSNYLGECEIFAADGSFSVVREQSYF